MPEACFMCLDSTEFMRNGDQFPNRLLAEQEAANLLANAKIESNAENTVGFLVMGGAACTVYETLTADVDRIMASIARVSIAGSVCHFVHGLLIASLALSHRTNPRAEKRIVVFVGSPVSETETALDTLARKLRRDDVGVDIVAFGVDENVPLLQNFVSRVNKQNNSRFLSVPRSGNLTDTLMGSPIWMMGEDMHMGSGDGAGGLDAGFGVDPSVDPQLAMAIRMSMEEERQRQAAAAAASAPAANPAESATDGSDTTNASATTTDTHSARSQALEEMAERDEENMSDEEMLQRAIQLSLQEAANAHGGGETGAATGDTDENNEQRASGDPGAQDTKENHDEEHARHT